MCVCVFDLISLMITMLTACTTNPSGKYPYDIDPIYIYIP